MPTLGAQILLIAFFIFSFLSQLSVVESRRHRHQISFLAPKAVVAAAAAAQAHLNRAAAAHHLKQRRRKFHANAQEFLLAHNKVRQALGEPPFLWDKKLAHYARRFASKRISDCRMIHSYGPYGENIFWADSTKYRPAEVVGFWIDEHRDYNGTSNMCAPGRSCGHYTQIVWRDSVQLGCALVECDNGGAYGICSYNPPGNFLNESPFEQHL